MANRKASVWLYVRTPNGWRYCRPVVGKNHKVRPQWAHVNGHDEFHRDAVYYAHYTDAGKQVWKRISTNPIEAMQWAEAQETWMKAQSLGLAVENAQNKLPLMISHTLDGYLMEYRLVNRPRSYALMQQTLYEFRDFVRKNLIDRITRLDLLKYRQWLIEKGRSERTASNKMLRVNQYLRNIQHLEPGKGLVTEKDGKYVEREPQVYSEEELARFFAKCDAFHFVVFNTFLMSGLRRKELENLTWDCVDFKAGTLKVEAKLGFSPKTWEERTVEIPTELINILKTLPQTSKYVFPTRTGGRWTHSWDDCKKIAKAAEVEDAFVHKFRATYATRLLQGGVDIKTVQKLCGWKSMESAMRYFAKAQSKEVRAKVDSVWNGSSKRRSRARRKAKDQQTQARHQNASKASAGG